MVVFFRFLVTAKEKHHFNNQKNQNSIYEQKNYE